MHHRLRSNESDRRTLATVQTRAWQFAEMVNCSPSAFSLESTRTPRKRTDINTARFLKLEPLVRKRLGANSRLRVNHDVR